MNEEIRSKVQAHLLEEGMSRADLARAISRTPEEITRALNNTGGRGGKVPEIWQDILNALELKLTVAHQRTGREVSK